MIERILRGVAGFLIVITLILGYIFTPYFYLLTLFIGLNLFQSAFTNWCPLKAILEKRWNKNDI